MVQCGALQCHAVHCSEVQCTAPHCGAVQCPALHCRVVTITSLHSNALSGFIGAFEILTQCSLMVQEGATYPLGRGAGDGRGENLSRRSSKEINFTLL